MHWTGRLPRWRSPTGPDPRAATLSPCTPCPVPPSGPTSCARR
ncbi:hypothetical protein EVA_21118 [gut metagenome]|uniref:Uncharacterized protein n=1 Tax=gut metagenome TaxID=749906 RepID=J9F7A2_9ZZZZ